MRTNSASSFKQDGTSRIVRKLPKSGTKLRGVFDLFQANRGVPIGFASHSHSNKQVAQLTDFYGLDLRRLSYGKWVLAGEWIDGKYIDYIAEHIKAEGYQHETEATKAD